MPNVLLLVPTGVGVGLTTVTLGLSRAFEEQSLRVVEFKAIDQNRSHKDNLYPHSVSVQHAEDLLSEGKKADLLGEILENFKQASEGADLIIIYGVIALQEQPYIANLNLDIANTLDASVVIVTAPTSDAIEELNNQLEIAARYFGGADNPRVLGCIINKALGPESETRYHRADLSYLYQAPGTRDSASHMDYTQANIFQHSNFRLLATVPWNSHVLAPRMKDIMLFLNANIISAGEINLRRVQYMTLYAKSISEILSSLYPGTLIITPADRADVIIAVCLAALSGIKIAGLLLTGEDSVNPHTLTLCDEAMRSGLPVLSVPDNSFRTAIALQNISAEIPSDDVERIELVKDYVASYVKGDWLKAFMAMVPHQHLSPAAFRYQLVQKAMKENKKIVLPEGAEPRTIAAAAICAERGLARCVLLGNPDEIHRVAQNNGVTLSNTIEIIDPTTIASRYVAPLVELRKDKGVTEVIAEEYLQDPVVVGTMMIHQGEVDGLVSGALHTTANTIRPALQIIKTAPGVGLVSSVFFMCLPTQVLVFGDCAVNPDPDAEALAKIAIQSADSAKAFGITPLVAMISYSTGTSGSGVDVDKVTRATAIVKQQRPDIIIDGPLQYDAAFVPEVAKLKAPNSPVAGKATVFIFPDLNTGNTTYKAVQRSSDALCIGPMLQGLRKPVNDLSRGATIDDIVYTIAITAVQASENPSASGSE